jgi:two-component system LytT family response regulator
VDGEIRVVVVDDEPLARAKLRAFLERARQVRVVAECAGVDDAVAALSTLRPHIVFLDIQMPDGTGFDVIQRVGPEHMPVVVFVTAYDEHALRAFEASAVDYLLKPFDEERFGRALDRAIRLSAEPGGPDAPGTAGRRAALADLAGPAQYPARLVVRVDGGYGFVRTAGIEWIEAADNYVVVHEGTNKVMVRRALARIMDELDPRTFLRVHRSAIVNVDRVRLVRVYSGTEYQLVLESGATILTGRVYRDQVRARLLQQGTLPDDER